jgi:hypothetical protein
MGTIKGWFVQGEINAMITLKFQLLVCTFQNYLEDPPPPPPNPRETSERMKFNDIDKKTFNLKTVYILISDDFFS